MIWPLAFFTRLSFLRKYLAQHSNRHGQHKIRAQIRAQTEHLMPAYAHALQRCLTSLSLDVPPRYTAQSRYIRICAGVCC
jgi:hypothetical protein